MKVTAILILFFLAMKLSLASDLTNKNSDRKNETTKSYLEEPVPKEKSKFFENIELSGSIEVRCST